MSTSNFRYITIIFGIIAVIVAVIYFLQTANLKKVYFAYGDDCNSVNFICAEDEYGFNDSY